MGNVNQSINNNHNNYENRTQKNDNDNFTARSKIRNASTGSAIQQTKASNVIDSINKMRNVQVFGQMDDVIMNDRLVGQITAYLIFVNCGTPPHYLDL